MSLPLYNFLYLVSEAGGKGGGGALHFIFSKMMTSMYRQPEYAMCVCVMFVDKRVKFKFKFKFKFISQ